MTHRPNMPTWDSFGQVQRVIRDRYREEERVGSNLGCIVRCSYTQLKYLLIINISDCC